MHSVATFLMEDYLPIVLAFVAILVCSILYVCVRIRHRNLPPGPWGLPVVGYLPFISEEEPHKTLTDLSKVHGGIYSLRMGSVFTVVLTDVKLIRQALALEAFSGRAPLYVTHGIMKGYGLICSEGELWRDQRKFTINCLRKFGMVKFGPKRDLLEERIMLGVRDALSKLKEVENSRVDVNPILYHCVGNVVSSFVLGRTWEEDDETWRWLHMLQEEGTKKMGVAGPLNFLPFLSVLPRYQKLMQFLCDGIVKTHEIYEQIIEDHRKTLDPETPRDYVDAYLIAMDQEEVKKELYSTSQFHFAMADLFGAGVDTTLTTLRWFVLYMAVYQDVQRKVQEELDGVVGGPGDRLPTLEDLPSLPYTEAAIAETQRIRSVVPVGIPHGTLQDTTLNGYDIPRGTMVVPLQWAVHMDDTVWKDPELFQPSRFLDDEGRFYKPENFIPFQTGKRMCLGDELARMMLFLFGSCILHQFSLSLPDGDTVDLKGECGITLTPKPYKLHVKSRM